MKPYFSDYMTDSELFAFMVIFYRLKISDGFLIDLIVLIRFNVIYFTTIYRRQGFLQFQVLF